MKIKRFYLGQHKVLKNFEIDFERGSNLDEERYSIDFIVGQNGSGKSVLLQTIFFTLKKMEQLSLNIDIPYIFELEYVHSKNGKVYEVELSNRKRFEIDGERKEEKVKLSMKINGEQSKNVESAIPDSIITLTSGSEEDWIQSEENNGDDLPPSSKVDELSTEERFLSESPGKHSFEPEKDSINQSQTKFTLIRKYQLPLVVFCGLLKYYISSKEREFKGGFQEVLTDLRVKSITGFSLRFRMNTAAPGDKENIENLKGFASRALAFGSERLLIFDLNSLEENKIKELLETFKDSLELFKRLSEMQKNANSPTNVLQEVNIFLERKWSLQDKKSDEVKKNPPIHLFNWLSDGEQSFLGRMSLFLMLGDTESIIILDEPEVHFNDFWKRKIVNYLDSILKKTNSHVLISSHSSITLSDVPKQSIFVLNRQSTYTYGCHHPNLLTFGASPSDIMTHVFDTEYAAGEKAVKDILEVLEGEMDSEERLKKLKDLKKEVAHGYWSFEVNRKIRELETEK